ncbi:MAG: hypothetical protein M1497_06340 [Nitrospirae bacterium]|nr:hypothetical protein [Nitrospirota bacterium]
MANMGGGSSRVQWGQANAVFRVLIVLATLSALLMPDALSRKGGSARAETPYFTNDDIEKYRKPSDGDTDAKQTVSDGKREAAAKAQERKEAEYWCRKATSYRKKIERDRNDLQEAEEILAGAKDRKAREKEAAGRKVEKAKRLLKFSEGDLSDLADEAHRKGVPPGWLRCQFE